MAKIQPSNMSFPSLPKLRIPGDKITGIEDAFASMATASLPRTTTPAMRELIKHRSVQIVFAVSAFVGLLASASSLASSVDQFVGSSSEPTSNTSRRLQIVAIAADVISSVFFITTIVVVIWAWSVS